MLLLMIQMHESMDPIILALARKGLLSRSDLESAQEDVRKTAARSAVEKLGTKDAPSVDDILKSFQGPIQ